MNKNRQKKKEQGVFLILDGGTFPYDIGLAINMPLENLIKRLEKSWKLDDEEKEWLIMPGTGRTVMLKSNVTIIQASTEKLPNKGGLDGVIAHEIFHAVEFIMDKAGIKYHYDYTGEVFAYLIQHFTQQVYGKLK